jgi:hypothetical protein
LSDPCLERPTPEVNPNSVREVGLSAPINTYETRVCRNSFLRIDSLVLQISAGNMHSIRNSCAVMSCGKPTVEIIEKYEILSLPRTKVIGKTGAGLFRAMLSSFPPGYFFRRSTSSVVLLSVTCPRVRTGIWIGTLNSACGKPWIPRILAPLLKNQQECWE